MLNKAWVQATIQEQMDRQKEQIERAIHVREPMMSSASFLAELSVSSPQKLFILII